MRTLNEARCRKCRIERVELVEAVVLKQSDQCLQAFALTGKVLCHLLGKLLIALREVKMLPGYVDAVEAVIVQPYPGQVCQSKHAERLVQCLSLAQAANVMKPGVKVESVAAVALQAAAGLGLTLKDKYTVAY